MTQLRTQDIVPLQIVFISRAECEAASLTNPIHFEMLLNGYTHVILMVLTCHDYRYTNKLHAMPKIIDAPISSKLCLRTQNGAQLDYIINFDAFLNSIVQHNSGLSSFAADDSSSTCYFSTKSHTVSEKTDWREPL